MSDPYRNYKSADRARNHDRGGGTMWGVLFVIALLAIGALFYYSMGGPTTTASNPPAATTGTTGSAPAPAPAPPTTQR